MKPADLQTIVWDYYSKHQRTMPWRQNTNPYWILVSEVMLQQTQVDRVIPKFESFMQQFPELPILSSAPFSNVLNAWLGLGYNRRARYLHMSARQLVTDYDGVIPNNADQLETLPGIGKNTAAAIRAYAFNEPVIFIETNIRTVILHHFFTEQDDVSDTQLLEVAAKVLDDKQPREWYWALMDYGTHVKKTQGNAAVRSRHHVKQKPFKGSVRELRGRVLRELAQKPLSSPELDNIIRDARLNSVLENLRSEGLLAKTDGVYKIAEQNGSDVPL